jgi:hypothetical protein
MDKFSVTTGETALTLTFEKAATKETALFHPWRYFKAEGETLRQIEAIISDYATVGQDYAALATKAGAKSYDGTSFAFDYKRDELLPCTEDERVDYNANGNANQPFQCKRIARLPGFVVSDSRSSGQFYPDVATPAGKALNDERVALKDRSQPMVRFAKWLENYGVEVPQDPAYPFGSKMHVSASATKIGGDWIVAVPVIIAPNDRYKPTAYTQSWTVPPDAAPISVSAYFTLLEKNSLIPNQPKGPKV